MTNVNCIRSSIRVFYVLVAWKNDNFTSNAFLSFVFSFPLFLLFSQFVRCYFFSALHVIFGILAERFDSIVSNFHRLFLSNKCDILGDVTLHRIETKNEVIFLLTSCELRESNERKCPVSMWQLCDNFDIILLTISPLELWIWCEFHCNFVYFWVFRFMVLLTESENLLT